MNTNNPNFKPFENFVHQCYSGHQAGCHPGHMWLYSLTNCGLPPCESGPTVSLKPWTSSCQLCQWNFYTLVLKSDHILLGSSSLSRRNKQKFSYLAVLMPALASILSICHPNPPGGSAVLFAAKFYLKTFFQNLSFKWFFLHFSPKLRCNILTPNYLTRYYSNFLDYPAHMTFTTSIKEKQNGGKVGHIQICRYQFAVYISSEGVSQRNKVDTKCYVDFLIWKTIFLVF